MDSFSINMFVYTQCVLHCKKQPTDTVSFRQWKTFETCTAESCIKWHRTTIAGSFGGETSE